MRQRFKESLVLVLSVDLNETIRELAKCSGRRQIAVDERAAAPGARHVAADQNLVPVRIVEKGFDRRLGFPGANEVCGRAGAQQQADGLDDNRLACPRLAGQDIEARLELDLYGLNHRKVADAEQTQHVGGTSIVSYV